MIRVLLVDDQTLIRAGLRAVLDHEPGIEVAGEADDGAEALQMVRELQPEVVVMDLRMPILDGVEATRRIRADAHLTAVRILVLTTFEGDREVLAAVGAGADGFLGKSADPTELVAAVQTVAAGDISLPQPALRAVAGALTGSRAARNTPVDPVLADRVAMLTEREREVVAAAAHGDDNDTIGRRLSISPYTVKTHLNRAMLKLDARDRGQLVALAHKAGLVE
ncbi:response regulator transcription factor [Nocardia carnea]|uniref:response regulator transcription factor n=1 Tax=Nocardia carnea TaxID=37328 RepID=UPI00245863D7|nr:response regulator transcription factor [Nocardia carnea]